MRIFTSGTACQGKSTFVNDFLAQWPMYRKATFDYRSIITDKKHSKETNKDQQMAILKGMVKEMESWRRDDNIIMDRGPLDNLIYSLWCADKGHTDIDADFINECVPIVCESFRNVDIIFFTPITEVAKIPIVEDGTRETDPEYIEEIDNLFKAAIDQSKDHANSPLWPYNDVPGIIEIFGSREERIEIAKLYVTEVGESFGDEVSIFNPSEISKLEQQLGIKKDPFQL